MCSARNSIETRYQVPSAKYCVMSVWGSEPSVRHDFFDHVKVLHYMSDLIFHEIFHFSSPDVQPVSQSAVDRLYHQHYI